MFAFLPIFAGYGVSRHAGSKLIVYGFSVSLLYWDSRFTNSVLPEPAMPSTRMHTGDLLI